MKALVLSAGYGERLRPLTETTPKAVLEVGGRPLIHYPLLMLREAGIREVAVNLHHLADEIEGKLGDGVALGLNITYLPEKVLLGTGGSLLKLRGYFGGEPFVIVNCDTILGLDLAEMVAFHRERGGLATLLLRVGDRDRYSRIEIDSAQRIQRMRLLKRGSKREFDDYPESVTAETAASLASYMYCGALVSEPAIFEQMPHRAPLSLMADVFAPIVAVSALYGFIHRGFFRTVDDLKGYEALREEFALSPPRLSYIAR